MPPLAASSWPLAVLLAVPGLAALFFLAYAFARNRGQRVAYMIIGFLGSLAALATLQRLTANPAYGWLLEGNARLIVAVTTVIAGAVLAIVIVVLVRKLSFFLIQGVKRGRS